jgi:DNA-binding GntR family transcriptional regulator
VDNGQDRTTSVAGVNRVAAASLVQLAADEIRRQILEGELTPGVRLGEEWLTSKLDISRPPLREALRILESEGLVEHRPRRGSYVTSLTAKDAREILAIRAGLERMAFETGIPVTDGSRLVQAHAALEQMDACARAGDRASLIRAGYAFHSALIQISNTSRLQVIYASVQQQILMCMALNLIARERNFEDLGEHVARHRRLLETVESGDLDRALAELADHGAGSFEQYLQ